jgi:hypothetical protein
MQLGDRLRGLDINEGLSYCVVVANGNMRWGPMDSLVAIIEESFIAIIISKMG